jgi:hypothetical protein
LQFWRQQDVHILAALGAFDSNASIFDVSGATSDYFASPGDGLQAKLQYQPLLRSELPAVLLDLIISPVMEALRLRWKDTAFPGLSFIWFASPNTGAKLFDAAALERLAGHAR